MKTLSIVIPVFNEEQTIEEVLRRVAAEPLDGWEKEIVVVDDGSYDNSKGKITSLLVIPDPQSKLRTGSIEDPVRYYAGYPTKSGTSIDSHKSLPSTVIGGGNDTSHDLFKTQNCILLSHEKNLGEGAAIRTALRRVTGDAVIIQDADLEYDPSDWPHLLRELDDPAVAAVYGSRNLAPDRRGYSHYVWGVAALTWFTNLLYGSRLTDIYTCYKLFRTPMIRSLPLTSAGFEFEAEVTAQLLKRGYIIREVPIHYHPRTFREGKKIRVRDGIVGLKTIFKNYFSSAVKKK